MKDQPIPDDDAQLASMGHAPELKRNFSMLYVAPVWRLVACLFWGRSMLGLAFAIMNVRCSSVSGPDADGCSRGPRCQRVCR